MPHCRLHRSSSGCTASGEDDEDMYSNVLCSNILLHICSFLTSTHVFKLTLLNRSWNSILKRDIFGTSSNSLGDVSKDTFGHSHIRVPLTYCSLIEQDGRYVWMDSLTSIQSRHRGYSMQNVELTGDFHKMPPLARLQFLWSLNFVRHLRVDMSFFECSCYICLSTNSTPQPSVIPPPPIRRLESSMGTMTDGTETPAVFAAFLLQEESLRSPAYESPVESPSQVSSDQNDCNNTRGVPSASRSPLVATVEMDDLPWHSCARKPVLPSPAVCESIAIRHAFDSLTLAFQIAYRNRATLKTLTFEGPPPRLSTALKRDDELPKLPFPLKPKTNSTAVKAEVMPSFVDGDMGNETTPKEVIEGEARMPPKFLELLSCTFGATVDCRYIVPFLDYSDFAQLSSVTVGRLTAQYSETAPQFGEKATVVFAPQYIFNQLSFPSAPHLPALYNGAIDENLRFQGRGIFVCDEYTYEGEFRDGVNHGYGRMKSRAGEQYTGMWKYGQRNGNGRVVQLCGDSLSGTWVNDSLSGYGTLETADGFSYVGNWAGSRFEGWGTIWYRNCLVCYGRFSRGFLCGWSRIARFSAEGGLTWEECRHDDIGRITRCFQMTLTLPMEGCGERVTISHMPLQPSSTFEAWISSLSVKSLDSPHHPKREHDMGEELGINIIRAFQHEFPDEESFWEEDEISSSSSSQDSEEYNTFNDSLRCCFSPAVAERVSPQNAASPCKSPARRYNVTRRFQRMTPTNATSPSFRSLSAPSLALLPPPPGPQDTASPTTSHLSLEAQDSPMTDSPISPPTVREHPTRANSVLPSSGPHESSSNGASMQASLSLPTDTSSPSRPRLPSPVLSAQRLIASPSSWGLTARSPSSNSPVEMQSPQMAPPQERQRDSRSRTALMQLMETVERVQMACVNRKLRTEDIWKQFQIWDQRFFKHVHCEWMRLDLKLQERKVTSPLQIPLPEDVPQWMRKRIWDHYSYRHGADRQ